MDDKKQFVESKKQYIKRIRDDLGEYLRNNLDLDDLQYSLEVAKDTFFFDKLYTTTQENKRLKADKETWVTDSNDLMETGRYDQWKKDEKKIEKLKSMETENKKQQKYSSDLAADNIKLRTRISSIETWVDEIKKFCEKGKLGMIETWRDAGMDFTPDIEGSQYHHVIDFIEQLKSKLGAKG